MRLALIALLLGSACQKEPPRYAVGPISVGVPEGFVDDVDRAGKLGGNGRISSQARVWVHRGTKMQVALSVARLPHQPEWDKVSTTVLLTEMVAQEMAAGEKAGLKTVSSDRKWDGEVLHYTVEGDMNGQLATSSQTALWVDARGDCWHASAVCTAKPADRAKCAPIVRTVRFDIAGFDAGAP